MCIRDRYDQRADSAQQCLMLLNNKQDVVIKSGRIVTVSYTHLIQNADGKHTVHDDSCPMDNCRIMTPLRCV